MVPLRFDARACDLIAARLTRHPDAVLRLDLSAVYGRSCPTFVLSLRWTTARRVEGQAGLVRTSGPHDVPLLVAPRLWRYLIWHPVTVLGQRFGPFTRLLPAVDPLFVDDMRLWERQHPDIALAPVDAA